MQMADEGSVRLLYQTLHLLGRYCKPWHTDTRYQIKGKRHSGCPYEKAMIV